MPTYEVCVSAKQYLSKTWKIRAKDGGQAMDRALELAQRSDRGWSRDNGIEDHDVTWSEPVEKGGAV